MTVSDPVKRHANEKVGALVLVAVALVVTAMFFSGRLNDWLSPGETFTVVLPTEGSHGLREGSEIEVLGTAAGFVSEIAVPADGIMRARILVKRDFARFVRADSAVTILSRFVLGGDAYLRISKGTGDPLRADTPILNVVADTTTAETVDDLVVQLRTELVPALADLRSAARAWTAVAAALEGPEHRLARVVEELSLVSERLAAGEGTIGRLLASEALVDRLEHTVERLGDGLERFPETMDRAATVLARADAVMRRGDVVARDMVVVTGNLRAESEELSGVGEDIRATLSQMRIVLTRIGAAADPMPRVVENLGTATDDLPALVLQSERTMRELERLLKVAQRSWLLGGSSGVVPASQPERIPPQRAVPQ